MKNKILLARKSSEINVQNFRKKYIKFTKKEKSDVTNWLLDESQQFLNKNFDMDMNIPIEISGRLTSNSGYFAHKIEIHESVKITLSEMYIKIALKDGEVGREAILDLLRHELVHYALYEQGLPSNDGDEYFERTLETLNVASSCATRVDKTFGEKKIVGYYVADVYYNPKSGKNELYKHTVKGYSNRLGYAIVKYA